MRKRGLLRHIGMPLAVGLWMAMAAMASGSWPLDRITLRDGRVLEGLIEGETEREFRMLEIRRAKGQGHYGVYLPVDRAAIARVERLSDMQRKESRRQFDAYRNRVSIEASRMAELSIQRQGARLRYEAEQFTLESTAPEEVVRRSIVRIEQMFAAMRQMIPERDVARRPISIRLYGSVSEYEQYVAGLGLPVANPAVFHPQSNAIAVGEDLLRVAEQLRQIERKHDALREQLEQEHAQLQQLLEKQIKAVAQGSGTEAAKRNAAVRLKADMKRRLASQQRQLERYDRLNEEEFQKLTARMFRMLYHEALHAYLENFVYPNGEYQTPRWLNEGLAQIFEASTLEGTTFRVGMPHGTSLERLKASLETISLADLLSAGGDRFLVAHGENPQSSQQYYAASWGLAHFLTFERNLIGTAAMDQYVREGDVALSNVARFERLVGMPLASFESEWRTYISQLQPDDEARQRSRSAIRR